MTHVLIVLFLLLGTAFSLLAAVGVFNMPDLFTRMHASTKSATLGVGCILIAVAIAFGETGVIVRSVLIISFIFITAPVAAHMIGRAAYARGVPLWKNSVIDELRDSPEHPVPKSDVAEDRREQVAEPQANNR